MQIGKFPEVSYKRTILKKMSHISEGLKSGVDAATIAIEDVTVVMSSNCILKWFPDCEAFYLQKTLNALYEKGAEAKGIQLEINVPQKYDEKKLGIKVKNLNLAAEQQKIPILQCRVYKGNVEDVIIHITVIGTTKYQLSSKNVKPAMDIVMAGAVGVGGTVILNQLMEETLQEKFSTSFIHECNELSQLLSCETMTMMALKHPICFMHNISDNGVFGALWELSVATNKGIQIDLRKIPMWQQVIEVCEHLDINPYMLEGSGSILIVCENGKDVVESLLDNNILASVIGKITGNNDKIVVNGDETRYLEPPKMDEIYKYL